MNKLINFPIHFYRNKNFFNLGDELAPYILKKLLKYNLIKVNPSLNKNAFFSVGSIIHDARYKTQVIWGSGLISLLAKPKVLPKILAIRGPLSLQVLNLDTNVALGDPALLVPDLFTPKIETKKYKLGIIPHYVDYENFLQRFDNQNEKSFLIMDIKSREVEKFISLLCQCEFVISSSLHGLILAHAYGIPAVWVEFSKRVIGSGFKFVDYLLSVSIETYAPKKFPEAKIYFEELIKLKKTYEGKLYIKNFNKANLYSSLDNFVTQYETSYRN